MKKFLMWLLVICISFPFGMAMAAEAKTLLPQEVEAVWRQTTSTEERLALLEQMVPDAELLRDEPEFSEYGKEVLDAYLIKDRPAAQLGEDADMSYLPEELRAFEKQRAEKWKAGDEAQGLETTRLFGTYIVKRVSVPAEGTVQIVLSEIQYVVYRSKNGGTGEGIYRYDTPHVMVLTKKDENEWYISADAYWQTYLQICSPDLKGCGDGNLDGDVDTTDARMALQIAVGKWSAQEQGGAKESLDVDRDETIDTTDARLILQKAVGKIDAF